MLEGLSIKEILISEPLESEIMRLEAEFYTAKTFDFQNAFKGESVLDFVQYGTSEELNEDNEGYPILRLNEFNSAFIGIPSKFCKKISNETFESLKLKKNDVLICRTNGNPKLVGKSALVPADYNYAYASYLFRIRPKREIINSSTLVCFLNSKFGRMEIEKFSMASNQVNFSPAKFREMRIPKFTNNLNQIIESNYFKAYQLLEDSKATYNQAESLLLKTLGLENFQPSQEPVNVKRFSESFGNSGRLDAEYYQIKYEEIQSHIFTFKNGYTTVSSEFEISKDVIDRSKKAYNYTEISDVNVSDGSVEYNLIDTEDLPANGKLVLKERQIIISKVRPYRGAVGIIRNAPENYVGSGAFTVLSEVSSYKLEALQVLLRSKPYQELIMKFNVGSSYPVVKDEDILQLPIPVIDFDKQQEIADLVKESFKLKKQSEHLLEVAKTAVEMAIEQDEEMAIAFIKETTFTA